MKGTRTYPISEERGTLDAQPGDYFLAEDNTWHGKTPNGLDAWLKNHHVEEHENKTISVLPGPWGSNSILAKGWAGKTWHGYINHGTWEDCDTTPNATPTPTP